MSPDFAQEPVLNLGEHAKNVRGNLARCRRHKPFDGVAQVGLDAVQQVQRLVLLALPFDALSGKVAHLSDEVGLLAFELGDSPKKLGRVDWLHDFDSASVKVSYTGSPSSMMRTATQATCIASFVMATSSR